MGFALSIVFLTCAAIGAGIAASVRAQQRREGKLLRIAEAIYGRAQGLTAVGRCRGHAVTYRFATRGAGRAAQPWTEVAIEVPRGYPLELHIRRHIGSDRRRIASGEMVDVEIGDPAFDPVFLVEAAPADVARVLLDAETRGYLMSHGQVVLDTQDGEGRKLLVLSMPGWQDELPEALAAVDTAARIAGRVRDAFADVDAKHAPRETGAPYRAELADDGARVAAAAREREVAELQAVRTQRSAGDAATTVIGIIVALVLLLMILAASAPR